jgi:hypothetical protein
MNSNQQPSVIGGFSPGLWRLMIVQAPRSHVRAKWYHADEAVGKFSNEEQPDHSTRPPVCGKECSCGFLLDRRGTRAANQADRVMIVKMRY